MGHGSLPTITLASIPKLTPEIVSRAPPSVGIPDGATESIRGASNEKLNEFDDGLKSVESNDTGTSIP
jgi:hypothetical protein